jgi:hypothetical protein
MHAVLAIYHGHIVWVLALVLFDFDFGWWCIHGAITGWGNCLIHDGIHQGKDTTEKDY